MRHKMYLTMLLAGALFAFGAAAIAQHEEHHPQGQAAQEQSQPGTSGGMMGQGMMGQGNMCGMMGMMNQMNTHHQQMSALMNKLMQSMKAIQNEKDPAALKEKIAEHSALLKQMHDAMMQQGTMMQGMSAMVTKSCPMSGGEAAPPAK